MPTAPKAKAAPIRKPAAGDDGNFHRIQHLRQQHGGRHRAGMAAAFAALYIDHVHAELLHGQSMFDRADGRHAENAGLLEARDHPGIRPAAEADGPDLRLVGDDQIHDLGRAGLEGMKIHAEKLVGAAAHRQDFIACFRWRHHRRAEEAEGAGLRGGNDQSRLRDPTHCRLDDRPAAAEPFHHHRVQHIGHVQPPACFLFAAAMDFASMPPRLLEETKSLCACAK
jgi:hypothetical protein